MSDLFQVIKCGILQGQSSLTDWIQAFGSGIAIVAAIYSFTKLFRKDQDKEAQIKSLTNLAENQSNINATMTLQLKEHEKQTSILKDFLNLFLEAEGKKSESNEFQRKLYEIEQRKRKLDIRPMFSFSGGHSNGSEFHWKFRNEGYRGILKEIKIVESKNSNLTDKIIDKMLESKSEFEFVGRRTDGGSGSFIPNFKINILFEDVEGNKYSQTFVTEAREKRMNEPVEVND